VTRPPAGLDGGLHAACDGADDALYPILMRLADRGLLETAWESEVPAGRRRRTCTD
jgi:Transcriptional regulator PadR-like family